MKKELPYIITYFERGIPVEFNGATQMTIAQPAGAQWPFKVKKNGIFYLPQVT
jgi:hypothetical protein